MNAFTAVHLMRKYSKCKQCGNEMVGDGEGTLEIQDEVFKRSCKCGWSVEVNTQKEG